MENASKALIIAASMLIGILILSLVVYLFVSFGSTSAEIHKQNAAQQIAQFNSQFTLYEEKTCTIYDVISVASLAKENNNYYELNGPATGKDNYISVRLNTTAIENKSITDYDQIINQDVASISGTQDGSLPQYKCQIKISPTTERVCQVTFTPK